MGKGQDFTDAKGFSILSQQDPHLPRHGRHGLREGVRSRGGQLRELQDDRSGRCSDQGREAVRPKAGESSHTFKMTMEIPGFGEGITSHMLRCSRAPVPPGSPTCPVT